MSYTDANIEDSDIKNLPDLNIPGLDIPKNLTDKIPTQEDAERLFEEKCRKNGGEDAYINAKVCVYIYKIENLRENVTNLTFILSGKMRLGGKKKRCSLKFC